MSVQNLNTFGGSRVSPTAVAAQSLISPPSLSSFLDPFADEADPLANNQDVGSQQNYIHIRVQQRNGRKTLTTLQGLPKGTSPRTLCNATRLADDCLC
jgi:translation initiation factor 1